MITQLNQHGPNLDASDPLVEPAFAARARIAWYAFEESCRVSSTHSRGGNAP